MIISSYYTNEERIKLVDFPHIFPDNTFRSILSSPKLHQKYNIFNILNAFAIDLWIFVLITYLLITSINIAINKSKTFERNSKIIFDYFGLLLGKGMRNTKIISYKYLSLHKDCHRKHMRIKFCWLSGHSSQYFCSTLSVTNYRLWKYLRV